MSLPDSGWLRSELSIYLGLHSGSLLGQGANHKHHLGLSEADRPRLVLVIWTVLGEACENDQKSNFKLVISRPESV